MNIVQTVTVGAEEGEVRLDRWFKRHYPQVTHGQLEKLLRTGQIRVDGGRAKANQRLQPGQAIRIPPLPDRPPPAPGDGPPPVNPRDAAELQKRVLHIDDWLIALDKPAGLATQGGTGVSRHVDGMLDALRFGGERPKLVHRLDRDTSGVLLLARTPKAAAALAAAFRDRSAKKVYWALVAGVPEPRSGRIDKPLAKVMSQQGERMMFDEEDGDRAITTYETVDTAGRRAAWLEMQPLTGRTHQLRVHAAMLGTPIVGDRKYGGEQAELPGGTFSAKLHLHARHLRLPHPNGGTLEIAAELPPHMQESWKLLGFEMP